MQVCKPWTSSSARIVAPIPKTTMRNAKRMKMTCSDRVELHVREVWERTCTKSTHRKSGTTEDGRAAQTLRTGFTCMPSTTRCDQGRLRNPRHHKSVEQSNQSPSKPYAGVTSKQPALAGLLCSKMNPSTCAGVSPCDLRMLLPKDSSCNTRSISRDPAASR